MSQADTKNTSTTLSRRSALALVGASSASLAVGSLAAKAAQTDSKLIELGQKWRAARKATMAVSRRIDDIHDAYDACALPFPEVCRPRPTDADGLNVSIEKWNVNDGFYSRLAISSIRDLKAEYRSYKVDDRAEDIVIQRVLKKTDLARRDEIIKAYDEWTAHDDAIREKTGYDQVDGLLDEPQDIETDILREIMAAPAYGIVGLKVKALLAIAYSDENVGRDPDDVLHGGRQKHEPQPLFDDIPYQLAWDILEMTGNGADA